VAVLALEAEDAEKLMGLPSGRLIGVWLTVKSIDVLRDRYRYDPRLAQ
jgi:hypothetical protein